MWGGRYGTLTSTRCLPENVRRTGAMDLLDGVLLLLALVIVYHVFRLGYAFVCFVFSLLFGWMLPRRKEETEAPYRHIPERVKREVWRRDGGRCVYCGSRSFLEYDHIVPVSLGGPNTVRNVQLLCEPCNRSKSNKV